MMTSARRSFGTVHPHASGEHENIMAYKYPSTGSSPREWGTRRRWPRRLRAARFIPTRVGNTWSTVEHLLILPVHPHASGEHFTNTLGIECPSGSSPREWGTPTLKMIQGPTSAVHPHASGEHQHLIKVPQSHFGSSPREWGTRLTHLIAQVRCRFIPTRVGNTFEKQVMDSMIAVHPHASGEHWRINLLLLPSNGSSPREWGTLTLSVTPNYISRFIPTRVGNTG